MNLELLSVFCYIAQENEQDASSCQTPQGTDQICSDILKRYLLPLQLTNKVVKQLQTRVR